MKKDKTKKEQSKSKEETGAIEETPDSSEAGENQETETFNVQGSEEYKQLNDKYLRLAAEFENYKKRSAREYSRVSESAESALVLQLLDVVDDFLRALEQDADDADVYKQGTRMIYDKLYEILKKRGLREIEAIDEVFDPFYHEAVMQREVEDYDDGIILEEVQKGYFLNSRVLRPAKVIVAKKKTESSGEKDNN